jgi:hypothetical protein
MGSHKPISRVLLAVALGAAITTIEPVDRTGQVIIREAPGGALDLFGPDGSRAGYGVRRSDGSTDLFRPDGSRLGSIDAPRPDSSAPRRIILSPGRR